MGTAKKNGVPAMTYRCPVRQARGPVKQGRAPTGTGRHPVWQDMTLTFIPEIGIEGHQQ